MLEMSSAEAMSLGSPQPPDGCRDCDTRASVTSDLHKYQAPCTCKPASVQYACAEEPGPPVSHKTSDETGTSRKSAADIPPALPPRPHNGQGTNGRRNQAAIGAPPPPTPSTFCSSRRKYGWWCVGCGALAALLGGLLAAAHILLRAYTASPQHLETVPAAVPAAMLVLTGICIMSLARRRNRYSYMIKVVGACCLVCALTCVLVTITTTVIHMNKLQTLRICEYTNRTRTCTCYSMPVEVQPENSDDEGGRCVFEGVSGCGVVHGALYWCLRAIFALSVTAVLVCIFSCMLAYQLLSHERKKMYWEQLELRCRSLYRPPNPTHAVSQNRPMQNTCSCCAQCHQSQSAWDVNMQQRFWTPGRVGNLYSPNPGTVRKMSPWSWFPWPRNSNQRCRMGAPPHPSSGDSAYGFCETEAAAQHYSQSYGQNYGQQYAQGSDVESTGGVWGPPPPYSPQGRGLSRHHLHQDPATTTLLHHHIDIHRNSIQIHDHQIHSCANRNSSYIAHLAHLQPELAHIGPDMAHLRPDLVHIHADVGHAPTAEVGHIRPEMVRMQAEVARLQSGELAHVRLQADMLPDPARIQQELPHLNPDMNQDRTITSYRGKLVPYTCRRTQQPPTHTIRTDKPTGGTLQRQQKHGKENFGFQNDVRASLECQRTINAESEVYFADVSSCCNVSIQADCCAKPNVSALVGTIENQPESTSGESDSYHCQLRPAEQKNRKKPQDKKTPADHLNISATHERLEHLTRTPDNSQGNNSLLDSSRRNHLRGNHHKASPKNIIRASPLHPRQSSSESSKSNISLNYLNRLDGSLNHSMSRKHPSVIHRSDNSDVSMQKLSMSPKFNKGHVVDGSSVNNVAMGHGNVGTGHGNVGTGHGNVGTGHGNAVLGNGSVVLGHGNVVSGHGSVGLGHCSNMKVDLSPGTEESLISDDEQGIDKCDSQYEVVRDE